MLFNKQTNQRFLLIARFISFLRFFCVCVCSNPESQNHKFLCSHLDWANPDAIPYSLK